MDRLNDNNHLVSLISGSKAEPASRKPSGAVEGDMFSRMLEKETGRSDKTAEKSREAISSEKKDERAASKEARAAEADARLKARLPGGGNLPSSLNYLYNLSLKSPDSLSMAEKQAFKVGEFSAEQVDMQEMQRLLGEHGLQPEHLDMQQMSSLLKQAGQDPQAFVSLLQERLAERPESLLKAEADLRIAEEPASTKEKKEEAAAQQQQGVADSNPPAAQQAPGFAINFSQEARQSRQAEEARAEQRENLVAQIINKVDVKTVGERTEMMLKLNPEYLGDMRIKLSSENGKMVAHFETTSTEVRGLIQESEPSLKREFKGKGLQLEDVRATLVESLA